jgi:peptidyl-prolyl cis-trans isomerase D
MLDSMRNLSKSIVSKALMLFLVLSFAVWGVGDIVRNQGGSHLVKVGDDVISPQAFMAEQRAMQQAMQEMGMQGVNAQALSNEILRRMVQSKLISQWQHDTGLVVGEDTLKAYLRTAPEFHGLTGKFDPKVFHQLLTQRQLTEANYLKLLAGDLGGKFMLASIDTSDHAVPQAVLAMGSAADAQTRDAVLFTLAPSAVSVADVSADDAKAYYEANTSEYQVPERRTLEYVTIDPASLESLGGKEATPEAREQAVHEMSMQVEDALAGGSSMGEALAEAGVKAQSRVLTKIQAEGYAENTDALVRQVVEQGFILGEDETSGLENTADGRYFMLHVNEVIEAAPQPYEEVSDKVKQAAAADKAREGTNARLKVLKEELADKKSWQDAAAKAKATTLTVSDVARPVISADGKVTASGNVPALLQQAMFERGLNEVAGPLTKADGTLTVALVTAIHNTEKTNGVKTSEAAAKAYRSQLGDSVSNGIFTALADRYPVVVNQAMMQQVMQSDAPNE